MILLSKLNETAYPIADFDLWVTGNKENIDLVVLGRVAHLGKSNNVKININDGGGYRSYDEQVKMYKLYKAGKLQATAAVPGTSWHGTSLAIDTSTQPIRSMSNNQLAKYGLCKPLKKEGWHIQPIETINMGIKCNMSLAPMDLAPLIKSKFGLADNTIEFLSKYKYASDLCSKLLSGQKTFSKSTMGYLKTYQYWDSLKTKLGL